MSAASEMPTVIAELLADFPRIVAGERARAEAKKASSPKKERTCEEQAILSKRGRGNRVKGASGEREWCSFAAPWFPGMERNLSQCRGGGRKEGGDVKGSALCDLCHLEIKRGNTSPKAAIRQAIADNAGKKIPAAVTRDDRGEWLMTFRAVDLLPLLQEALAYRDSVAIELVVGTEEDEAEAEKGLGQSDEPVAVPA